MMYESDSGRDGHIGQYVRDNIIPPDLTVTEAARLLGIGRPALSNFLNGRARLSKNMAIRLERTFGADGQSLLDMQTRIERQNGNAAGQGIVAGTYAPTILTIRAKQISAWADRIESRSRLAALIRKLVHSTGIGITRADFPAYDDAERHGWDGYVEASEPTPWIPDGVSVWELGSGEDPESKAERDYRDGLKHDGLKAMSTNERAERVFVFVTPRKWNRKTVWAKEKRELGHWRDVRAYDSSDLEQWVEQSMTAQVWLAEELERPVAGYRSLDACWIRWSKVTEPILSRSLFDSAISAHTEKLKKWLDTSPSNAMMIAADSKDEVLAFISCFAEVEQSEGEFWPSRAVVFDTTEGLRKLASSLPPDIVAISSSIDVERELAPLIREVHCVFARPRGLVDSKPDITLDRLSRDDFEAALEDMNIKNDEADRLGRESARSLTILRRRLSTLDIIRTPPWAGKEIWARKLSPIALIGSWRRDSHSDQEVVKALARESDYESVESNVTSLQGIEDTPVWRVGEYRGAVSKLDALFAIGRYIPEEQLEDFFRMAEYVISEFDPSLELDDDKQWAAALYEKVREHSETLRTGVCETLAILGAHGSEILKRPELDAESRVRLLVRTLLGDSDSDKLKSLHSDLPNLAEAAPDEFIRIIEKDLRSDNPVVLSLFSSEGDALFSTHRHTGLLWALERLAWDPANLLRVVRILAELRPAQLPANLGNTPMATLQSIFRSWIPQTAAGLEQRLKVLEFLTKKYADVGWEICIGQIPMTSSSIGKHNERPRWRSDASGAGQVVSVYEMRQFMRSAARLALHWPHHDENTLGELIDRVHRLPKEEQEILWDRIDQWIENSQNEATRTKLWDKLRMKSDTEVHDKRRMQRLVESLAPTDLVLLHQWLFSWKQIYLLQVYPCEEIDFEEHDRRINAQRLEALRQIWDARGFEGVRTLIESSDDAPNFVGSMIPQVLTGFESLASFVRICIATSMGDNTSCYAYCLREVLKFTDTSSYERLDEDIEAEFGYEGLFHLFLCMPFRSSTWRLLDEKTADFRTAYWEKVIPVGFNSERAELNEIVDRLVEANRPIEAFNSVNWYWKRVETSRIKRLLVAMASAEPYGYIDQFRLSSAFDALDERTDVTTREKAGLEFMYISGLSGSERGIPNLELLISDSPAVFIELIEAVYGEKPDQDDQGTDESVYQARGSAAYFTLQKIRRTPGTDEDGNIDIEVLKDWLHQVHALSADMGLTNISDRWIGELLSRAPADSDGYWPRRTVCEAMEWLVSEDAANGFMIGVFNSRGVITRGKGGDQERKLAQKYRSHARNTEYEYPFVSDILRRIAEDYEREAEWWDTRAEVDERLHG